MAQLRSVACHMGSHSVTCYPTQVNTPRLNPSHAGRYSIYLPRRHYPNLYPIWAYLFTEVDFKYLWWCIHRTVSQNAHLKADRWLCLRSPVVECWTAKREVQGSNPFCHLCFTHFFLTSTINRVRVRIRVRISNLLPCST